MATSDSTDPMVQIRLSDLMKLRAAAGQEAANDTRRKSEPVSVVTAAPSAAEYLTTREAAAVLGVSTKCLESWRSRGEGPQFTQLGRAVRYHSGQLRAWAG